jgi:hypothetical protein
MSGELSLDTLKWIARQEIARHRRYRLWRPVCLHCTQYGCPYMDRAIEFLQALARATSTGAQISAGES